MAEFKESVISEEAGELLAAFDAKVKELGIATREDVESVRKDLLTTFDRVSDTLK